MARLLPLVIVALLHLQACSSERREAPRCKQCGMVVEPTSRWRAGLTAADGAKLSFCAPRCMLRYSMGPHGRGSRDGWVVDYYRGRRIAARDALFVLGSDVVGPMGHDFVPLADRPSAERFRDQHHGQEILELSQIGPPQFERLGKRH